MKPSRRGFFALFAALPAAGAAIASKPAGEYDVAITTAPSIECTCGSDALGRCVSHAPGPGCIHELIIDALITCAAIVPGELPAGADYEFAYRTLDRMMKDHGELYRTPYEIVFGLARELMPLYRVPAFQRFHRDAFVMGGLPFVPEKIGETTTVVWPPR